MSLDIKKILSSHGIHCMREEWNISIARDECMNIILSCYCSVQHIWSQVGGEGVAAQLSKVRLKTKDDRLQFR